MREIFEAGEQPDPGRVFYTIRWSDVRKRILRTEIGPVDLSNVLGQVQAADVGKRVYRVPADDGRWIWQIESTARRDERMAADSSPAAVEARHRADTAPTSDGRR